jgi:hypothetical protein
LRLPDRCGSVVSSCPSLLDVRNTRRAGLLFHHWRLLWSFIVSSYLPSLSVLARSGACLAVSSACVRSCLGPMCSWLCLSFRSHEPFSVALGPISMLLFLACVPGAPFYRSGPLFTVSSQVPQLVSQGQKSFLLLFVSSACVPQLESWQFWSLWLHISCVPAPTFRSCASLWLGLALCLGCVLSFRFRLVILFHLVVSSVCALHQFVSCGPSVALLIICCVLRLVSLSFRSCGPFLFCSNSLFGCVLGLCPRLVSCVPLWSGGHRLGCSPGLCPSAVVLLAFCVAQVSFAVSWCPACVLRFSFVAWPIFGLCPRGGNAVLNHLDSSF